jgi:hypothetical protein
VPHNCCARTSAMKDTLAGSEKHLKIGTGSVKFVDVSERDENLVGRSVGVVTQ